MRVGVTGVVWLLKALQEFNAPWVEELKNSFFFPSQRCQTAEKLFLLLKFCISHALLWLPDPFLAEKMKLNLHNKTANGLKYIFFFNPANSPEWNCGGDQSFEEKSWNILGWSTGISPKIPNKPHSQRLRRAQSVPQGLLIVKKFMARDKNYRNPRRGLH